MDFISTIEGVVNLSIPVLDNVPVLRGILGILLVFFAPGFAWSLVFFRTINRLERLVLSAGLSIALVTLSVFGLNMALDVPVNGMTSLVIILIMTAVPLCIYYARKYIKKKQPE
ncbi:MAG: DUF1616 domain-containing protein [Dehalococcoidales bacterium]|nr:DUF1616 domain-containing protein [Dehalococcoidales bacterium]